MDTSGLWLKTTYHLLRVDQLVMFRYDQQRRRIEGAAQWTQSDRVVFFPLWDAASAEEGEVGVRAFLRTVHDNAGGVPGVVVPLPGGGFAVEQV